MILGSGRPSGGGHDNPLQYSSLKNPMDRGGWQAAAYRVSKSQTQLKRLSTCACTYIFLYHVFFISRHLGCFHILAIINYASMNIGVHIFFQDSSICFFGEILKSRMLDHMVFLFLILWTNFMMFSIVTALSCLLTNSAQVFSLLHILPDTCYFLFFF